MTWMMSTLCLYFVHIINVYVLYIFCLYFVHIIYTLSIFCLYCDYIISTLYTYFVYPPDESDAETDQSKSLTDGDADQSKTLIQMSKGQYYTSLLSKNYLIRLLLKQLLLRIYDSTLIYTHSKCFCTLISFTNLQIPHDQERYFIYNLCNFGTYSFYGFA